MKKICLALVVLLIAAFVPASAESIYDETYTESIEDTVKTWFTTSSGYARTPNLLYMSKNVVTNDTKQVMTRLPSSYITNYGSLPDEGQNWPVEYKRHDNFRHVGYGEYGYFKLKIGSTDYLQITASFDELDAEAVSGDTIITINSLGSPIVYPSDRYWDYWTEQKYIWSSISTDTSGYKCAFGSIVGPDYTLFAGTNYIFIWGNWQNRLIIESEQQGVLNQSTITLQRVFSDGAHPSEFHVKYGNTTVSKTASTDQFLTIPEEFYPFSTHVKSISGKWHNETFYSDSGGDPGGLTVTVYVKNSQTGAIIANSNIVIDALVNGEYYPVVNKTEPSGIFSITLQPTGGGQPNPDSYRLIATADGYNNPMPEINFTVDDSKKYIYCLLDPIAGGPENENNTFIDFFVRDMSSNPISAATVKFGKYTLITNSQGYTVFEVPKNADYTYTVSKSGYGSLTGNAVIGDVPRHTINTVLAPAVTPTKPTPIPTSTSITPKPTMTAPSGEPVSNWLEWFAAHFGMILGGGVEIGKIFMWLCFSVPVGVYVGKEAKAGAAGFMAGAGIVTLFFVLIGWVPIWLLVLLALIIGLLYAKVFNNSDTGGGR